MEETNRYEELVNEIEQKAIKVDSGIITFNKKELLNKIQAIKDEKFKNNIIEFFHYELTNYTDGKENRKIVKSGNHIDFITQVVQYNTTLSQFVNEHWNEIDKIIAILQDYILHLEIEEVKEEKGETEE